MSATPGRRVDEIIAAAQGAAASLLADAECERERILETALREASNRIAQLSAEAEAVRAAATVEAAEIRTAATAYARATGREAERGAELLLENARRHAADLRSAAEAMATGLREGAARSAAGAWVREGELEEARTRMVEWLRTAADILEHEHPAPRGRRSPRRRPTSYGIPARADT